MNTIHNNPLLEKMQALASQAQASPKAASMGEISSSQFQQIFQDAIGKVNGLQMQSDKLSEAFTVGDPNVSISQVMVGMQKANLSFQALSEVRNKCISAYRDIMNMQV